MNEYATNLHPQRKTSGKTHTSPDTPKHRPVLEWTDNRPEAASQQQLAQLIRNTIPPKQFFTHPNSRQGEIIQRQPIKGRVTGITHLVQVRNGSIFEGEVVEQVSEGMKIIIESTDRIRSRRGPNQEYNRADDWEGEQIYRWIRITTLNGQALPEGTYIRDDTFIPDQPLPQTPLSSLSGRRERQGELPRQKVLLVGTQHGQPSLWQESMTEYMDGSDIIVEYPLGSRPSSDHTQIPKIRDDSQNDFIANAASNDARVFGADGRKRVTSQGVEAMSLRYITEGAKIIELNPDTLPEHLMNLASQWFSCCLALADDDDPMAIVTQIADLVDYSAANIEPGNISPDMQAICWNIFRRVRTFTKYFKPEVKEATKETVESELSHDLAEAGNNYQESLGNIRIQIQTIEKNIEEKSQCLATMKEDNPAHWEMLIMIGELSDQLTTYRRYQNNDILIAYREEAVSAFHDALCNLTLFVEALARNRSNLVIAFGNRHVELLKSLLKKIDKQHKNYELHEPSKEHAEDVLPSSL